MNQQMRLGIVGGGQLGKMLTQAAKKLGFFVTVIDPTPQSPAGQVADEQIIADYKDEAAIRLLAKKSDVITFEVELAGDTALFDIMQKGTSVHPSPKTLSVIRDKLHQKEFLKKHKIPAAKFIEIKSNGDILKVAKKIGYPFLLKARTDAYDGRGNVLVKSKVDINKGLEKLQNRSVYVEHFVPFVKEIAVMIARNPHGKIAMYPVVETIQKDNICDTVIAPAQISIKARKNAERLAKKTMMYLKGAGVFGIEMFLLKDDNVFVNEIAPRVHNSGHYTIEACITSQFEQHIRCVANLPLGSVKLVTHAAVMKNILGEKNGNGIPLGIEKSLKIPEASLHIYGKSKSRPFRKMGHITVVGNNVEECLKKANSARRAIII